MDILIPIIAAAISALVTQIMLLPKLKATKELDRQVTKENEEGIRLKGQLQAEVANLRNELSRQKSDIAESTQNLSLVDSLLEQRKNSIDSEAQKIGEAAEIIIEQRLEEAARREKQKYIDVIEAVQQECSDTIEQTQLSITNLEETLNALRQKVLSINEDNKRAEEIKSQSDFYRLQISERDLKEVQKLREIGKELHDPVPLNKLIWTYYQRNLYSEMCGRVVGTGTRSGIQKITNLENGMMYIGQSVNIKDRWGSHIKAGLGAESATRNKLYLAMSTFGVENFTFEILEECSSEQLNEREKFYIEFYDSANYGYNVTRGGS